MKAADHTGLHQQLVQTAAEVAVIAQHSNFMELAGISLALLEIATLHLEASRELARKERQMRIRHFLIGLLVIGVLLIGLMSVLAQDTGTAVPSATLVTTDVPVEPPTPALPPTTETPEDILGVVLASLFAGAATIGGSVLVTALVGIEKAVIPASVVSGDTLKNITAVVVWIAYSIAIKFGLGTQFQGLAAILAPILVTATPLVGVLIGSAKLYLAAKTHNVPIWGYQRG